MSDLAYDISYLLDMEPVQPEAPVARVARAVPAAPPPSLADVQDRLARELLQTSEAHEEWIRQYLVVHGNVEGGVAGH